MTTSLTIGTKPAVSPEVRRVELRRPLVWLRAGWQDLKAIGAPALAHGGLIALLGAILLMLGSSHVYLTAAAVSGYLLVGPIMTTGLCELARRRGSGEALGFDESLQALTRNGEALLHFGALLALIAVIWFSLSVVLLQSVFNAPTPTLADALWGGAAHMSAGQWLGFIACGGVLALLVFAVSVVSVPLMLDRHARASEAMRTSLRAVAANLPAMLVWAGLIVLVNAVGFLTLLVGMVVVTPVLGFATWHAYRDLVV